MRKKVSTIIYIKVEDNSFQSLLTLCFAQTVISFSQFLSWKLLVSPMETRSFSYENYQFPLEKLF